MHCSYPRTGSRDNGFTLIEVTIVVAVLGIVTGVMYTFGMGFTRAAQVQEAALIVRDDSRFAMMQITKSLRMGIRGTMVEAGAGGGPISTTPVSSVSFFRVADENGNGSAINEDFSVGDSPPIVFRVDTDDINSDGLSDTQLIELIDGQFSRVLANYISPVFVDTANPGSGTNAPIGGLVFQSIDNSILVTIITRKQVIGGPVIASRLDQLVRPRN